MRTKLVITLGNPNGVGPEISAKSLSNYSTKDLSNFVVVGNKECIEHYFSQHLIENLQIEYINPDNVGVNYKFEPGNANTESGLMSLAYLDRALDLIKQNNYPGIVTAPLSKELIARSGKPGVEHFLGHTGYIADFFAVKKYSMMFYSSDLKVTLATIHIPLKEVPKKLTAEKLETAIQNSLDFCRYYYKENFRIAVCGLNPHAGENGLLGDEEENLIIPVIERYRKQGKPVEGPFPSDSLFYYALRGDYQMVVALYHDQALAPFKMLHFMDGVNVTLGLPIIRTSPDHGTAFNIAGKNIADPSSMNEAIRLALKISGTMHD